MMKELGEEVNEGRPSAESKVIEWQSFRPYGTKKECKEELELSYNTVRKWWDESLYREKQKN